MSTQNDYDYIVIGSGFGGSVSALRLAESLNRFDRRWQNTSFLQVPWQCSPPSHPVYFPFVAPWHGIVNNDRTGHADR